MSEHVTAWITAYHDGELSGARLRQVVSHLHECAACRAELDSLEGLSALLQESPAMPERTSSERFVAQVRLRLPPHASPSARMQALKAGWLALPLAMLGVWAFLQAVLVVSGLALIALPFLGGLPGVSAKGWHSGETAAVLLVIDTGLTGVLAALVWAWLAGWWAARQKNVRSSGEVAG